MLDFFIKHELFLLSSNNCFIIMPLPPHWLWGGLEISPGYLIHNET